MKQILKLTFAVMMAMIAVGLQSCGDDKEEDEPTATTIDFSKVDNIIGTWYQVSRIDSYGTIHDANSITFIIKADGTFDYYFGEGGIYHVSGTYEYYPQSNDKGIILGEKVVDGVTNCYTFTLESYSEYRYKVRIQQPGVAAGASSLEYNGLFAKY